MAEFTLTPGGAKPATPDATVVDIDSAAATDVMDSVAHVVTDCSGVLVGDTGAGLEGVGDVAKPSSELASGHVDEAGDSEAVEERQDSAATESKEVVLPPKPSVKELLPDDFHVFILTTQRNPHSRLVSFLRDMAGFKVSTRPDIESSKDLLKEDATVAALILDITENAPEIVKLARFAYGLGRSLPVALLCPDVEAIDKSNTLSAVMAEISVLGVAIMMEKPAQAPLLAFRLRVLIDRYRGANATFQDVCGNDTKKLPPPPKKESKGGRGWQALREARSLSQAKAIKVTEDTVIESLDAQYYSPMRLHSVRRDRVQAVQERMRAEQSKAEEKRHIAEVRRIREKIDVTDTDTIFAEEIARDKAAHEARIKEQRRLRRQRWEQNIEATSPRVPFVEISSAESIGTIDEAMLSVRDDFSEHEPPRQRQTTGHRRVASTTSRSSKSKHLSASQSAPQLRDGGKKGHRKGMSASSPALRSSSSPTGSNSTATGAMAEAHREFLRRVEQMEHASKSLRSLARRREIVDPKEDPLNIPRESVFTKSLRVARRRASIAAGSTRNDLPAKLAAKARATAPATLRRRFVLTELRRSKDRARMGQHFDPDKHLDREVPAEEGWTVWSGLDVVHLHPQEPADIHLAHLSKADKWIMRGLACVDNHEHAEAIACYTRAIRADARQHISYLLRGVCHVRARSYMAGVRDLSKMLDVQPNNVHALYNRACAYAALGDPSKAMDDLFAALFAAPKPLEVVLRAQAVLFRRAGMFLEANETLMQLQQLYPKERQLELEATQSGEKAEEASKRRTKARFEVPPDQSGQILQHFLDGDSDGYDSEISDITSISSDDEPGISRERRRSITAAMLPAEGLDGYEATPEVEVAASAASDAKGDSSDSDSSDAGTIVEPAALTTQPVETMAADIIAGNADMYLNVFSQSTEAQLILKKPSSERSRWELSVVCRMLSNLGFFRQLVEHTQLKFAKALEYRVIAPGEYVCEQGGDPDYFFICMSGTLTVKVNVPTGAGMTSEITVNSMKAGDAFGQLSILFNSKRGASVVSKHHSEVLGLTEKAFTLLGLRKVFSDELDDKEAVLRRSGIFTDLTKSQIRKLSSIALPRHAKKGEVLVAQGEPPDSLFFLRKGICTVHKKHDVLADLEIRATELQRELQRVRQYYVYHHSLASKTSDARPDDEGKQKKKRKSSLSQTQPVGSPGRRKAASARRGRSAGKARHSDTGGYKLGVTAATIQGARNTVASGVQTEDSAGMHKRVALEKELAKIEQKRDRVLEARESMQETRIGKLALERSAQLDAQAVIATLFPPAIFGEQSILNPDEGFAQATVVADTYVEVLVLNKLQLESSLLTKTMREAIREKSVRYPSNDQVYKQAKGAHDWKSYKSKLMRKVSKAKWPVDQTKVHHFAGGESVIVD